MDLRPRIVVMAWSSRDQHPPMSSFGLCRSLANLMDGSNCLCNQSRRGADPCHAKHVQCRHACGGGCTQVIVTLPRVCSTFLVLSFNTVSQTLVLNRYN